MVKGLLIRTRGPLGVVMTPEGRFVRVILSGKNRVMGQEVQGRELRVPSLNQGLAAASVFLVLLIGLWVNTLSPAAAAYVALDINPSIELSVDASGKVIAAKGLDPDGVALLAGVATEKLEIYKAVTVLVEKAVQHHYLNETNNVVLATITTAASKEKLLVDEETIQVSVNKVITNLPIPVKVVTGVATPEEHQQADQKGLSVGRYLIYREGNRQGGKISIEDVKSKGLGQLEKEKGIEIEKSLPNTKSLKHPAKKLEEKGNGNGNREPSHVKTNIPSHKKEPGGRRDHSEYKEIPVIKSEDRVKDKEKGQPPMGGQENKQIEDDPPGDTTTEPNNEERRDDRRQNPSDTEKQPENNNNSSENNNESPKDSSQGNDKDHQNNQGSEKKS